MDEKKARHYMELAAMMGNRGEVQSRQFGGNSW